ncbi:cell division protein SepF [Micromonospora sp. NBC_01796]|uniref:cell division protein SepF n=1 Tax=Micromonospora sp. NBC_01796 TaxID=2975987 RepID=UPI002DD7F455|nr:cell division protein SepF [Micromonospora sp. NBC_01796]WSA84407.1 cell division protein SepF [Micromonospora sp. NBC_01796]
MVMDLTSMVGPVATPFVDFAAGLVVARGCAMDLVAPGMFVLVPPGKSGPRTAGHPVGVPA